MLIRFEIRRNPWTRYRASADRVAQAMVELGVKTAEMAEAAERMAMALRKKSKRETP